MKRKEAIKESMLEHFNKTQDEMVNIMCPGSFGLGPICDNKTRKIIQKEKGIIKIIGCREITCVECWNEEYEEVEIMKSSIEDIMIKSASERIENRAKEIIDIAIKDLMDEMCFDKKSDVLMMVAEDRAVGLLKDILINGKIKEEIKVLENISKEMVIENAIQIEKIMNLMAVNDMNGDEILEIVEKNIEIKKQILNKTEKTTGVFVIGING